MMNLDLIKVGHKLTANTTLFNPYNAKRICTKGVTYPVVKVERAMGTVHRIVIDTNEDSAAEHCTFSIMGDSLNLMHEFSLAEHSYVRRDGYTISVDIRCSSREPNICISRCKRNDAGDSFLINCDQRFIALMRGVFAEIEARGGK